MDEYVRETLGEYLRREREARHISLEEIPATTRISSPFIRALEENDFGFFSQQEAIPGYLKLYARHLGLDYDDVLRRYEIQVEMNNRSKAFQQLPLFLDFASPIRQAEKKEGFLRTRVIGIIAAAVVAILLTGVSLYLYLLPEKAGETDMLPSAPPQPLAQKEPAPALPAAPQEREAALASVPAPAQPSPSAGALTGAIPNGATATATEQPAAPPAPAARKTKKPVIGNRDSKRYHLPGMKFYDKVKAYHRVEFASEEEARKAGYHKARE